MTWIAPEKVVTYKGVTIYHVYKHQNEDDPLEFWFTTDENEDPVYEFDIRDLNSDGNTDIETLKAAIDSGEITEEGINK